MISSHKRLWFNIVLLSLLPLISFGQEGKLVGLFENQIVEIDPTNGSSSLITKLIGAEDKMPRRMTYIPEQCKFYALNNLTTVPELVSFDFQGNFEVVGELLMQDGSIVRLAEGLAYNDADGKLYAAVSLFTGSSNDDFYSETLIEINPSDASCVYVADLDKDYTSNPDIDAMTFIGNDLYFTDARPELELINVYKATLNGLIVLAPQQLVSNFQNFGSGLTNIDNTLYSGSVQRNSLFKLENLFPTLTQVSEVGQIYSSNDYEGKEIGGIEYVSQSDFLSTIPDTTFQTKYVCQNEVTYIYGQAARAGDQVVFNFNGGQSCDSVVIWDVIGYDLSTTQITLGTCGKDYAVYNNDVIQAGEQKEYIYPDIHGCDSTVTVHVNQTEVHVGEEYKYIHACGFYTYNDSLIYPGNSYTFRLTNIYGCDSLVTIVADSISCRMQN